MISKTYTMIDPKQIAKKGYKGCKTTSSVQNFCKTNKVECCYWKPQGSTQKIMMIEWNSFRNAYKANQSTMNTTTAKAKSTTKTRKNAKSNITSITSRSTGRTTSRTKSSARKTNTTWGTIQGKKTNNARRTTTRGTKVRRAA
jgi:hypothetical protein